jgi:hypothetical protein
MGLRSQVLLAMARVMLAGICRRPGRLIGFTRPQSIPAARSRHCEWPESARLSHLAALVRRVLMPPADPRQWPDNVPLFRSAFSSRAVQSAQRSNGGHCETHRIRRCCRHRFADGRTPRFGICTVTVGGSERPYRGRSLPGFQPRRPAGLLCLGAGLRPKRGVGTSLGLREVKDRGLRRRWQASKVQRSERRRLRVGSSDRFLFYPGGRGSISCVRLSRFRMEV